MQGRILPIFAAAVLAACTPVYPGSSEDYDATFAAAYFRDSTGWKQFNTPPAALTVEQLFAVHRYGLSKVHPSFDMNEEFARRGADAAPFLRQKLERQSSFSEVASILVALKAMQAAGTFDLRAEPGFVALVKRAAAGHKDPLHTLANMSDELETATRIPIVLPIYHRKPLEPLGRDYDRKLAEDHCERCDYRQYIAGLDAAPLEKLFALQRYQRDKGNFFRNVDHIMALRGPGAVPFLKEKLKSAENALAVDTIVATLGFMLDLGTYDVAQDLELMGLTGAAVERHIPKVSLTRMLFDRLQSGKKAARGPLPLMTP